MFKMWCCCTLPWHKWVKCEPVSAISDKLTCSCGQAYGMNNSERIMLPWDRVEMFYRDLARIQGAVGNAGGCAEIAERLCDQGRDGYQIAKVIRAGKGTRASVSRSSKPKG